VGGPRDRLHPDSPRSGRPLICWEAGAPPGSCPRWVLTALAPWLERCPTQPLQTAKLRPACSLLAHGLTGGVVWNPVGDYCATNAKHGLG